MLTFLIDTSTERGLIAIAIDHMILAEQALELRGNQNHLLFPAIEALFKSAKLTSDKIERLGVGIGPGSYTGIRVAATIAKSLAFAKQLPMIGIPTLMLFQSALEGPFASAIDARIGGFYLRIGDQPSRLLSLEEAIPHLKAVPAIVSPYVAPIQRRLREHDIDVNQWVWEEVGPSAQLMAGLVIQQYSQGLYRNDGQLDLLYLRKTQAELDKMQG